MADNTEAGHVSGQSNSPLTLPAHALSYDDVRDQIQTDLLLGLGTDEAATRLTKYGPNSFGDQKEVQPLQIFIAQVVNAMTLILCLALAASFAIKAWVEGGVLAALILINIVIGFFQDLQAARTIASLKSLSTPEARVVRGGTASQMDAAGLVPGDIIELKVGDSVPADGRIVEAVNLEVDESLLTGESVPSRKDPSAILDADTGPGDRSNIVFSSSIVTKGRGRAIVFATGMFTEVGAIAAALREESSSKRRSTKDEDGQSPNVIMVALRSVGDWLAAFLGLTVGTPLQRKLSRLFLYVFAIAIVCALVVLGANKMKGQRDVVIYAIATALGTLPVTLILVLTITMAAGTNAMLKRDVIVRSMRSLEALGGVTNICSDKTGTLTQGKMVTRMVWVPQQGTYSITDTTEPYNPEVGTVSLTPNQPSDGDSSSETTAINPLQEKQTPALRHLLDIATIANLATVRRATDSPTSSDKEGSEDGNSRPRWEVNGDPTEIAIQVLAARFGRFGLTDYPDLKQVAEFPFESSVKKMSLLCRSQPDGEIHIFTKGAVERVLDACSHTSLGTEGQPTPMTDGFRSIVLANMEALARRGLRVLALADGVRDGVGFSEEDARLGKLKREEYETSLVFRGLVGIYDPPRPESRPSVFKCHQADIKVHMLTGDHPETARSIATEVGILPSRPELLRPDLAANLVMSAHDFDALTDAEVDQLPDLPLVVARCAPSTKVRVIEALHRRGGFVAMTGDGVNDSPSLKRADIGIAMGQGGSDVAKSASDIILADDNFASILNAVEEGRRIFSNVQKFMLHVLAANLGFVTTLLVGLAYKDASGSSIFQVTPVEILFMLLVVGAVTETGLGFEAASPDVLRLPPQSLKYGVFIPEFIADMFGYGVLMMFTLLGSFAIVMFGIHDGDFGENCNIEYSPSCNAIFRARTTCFSVMMWAFAFLAWELVDFRRSLFEGMISTPKVWFHRLWRNPYLFWSVVLSVVSIVPTIYIPTLNTRVFLHGGIDVEWGIVVGMTLFFVVGSEGYKWAKRVYMRRKGLAPSGGGDMEERDLENRAFAGLYM